MLRRSERKRSEKIDRYEGIIGGERVWRSERGRWRKRKKRKSDKYGGGVIGGQETNTEK